jgi:hypothetical protein
MNTQGPYRVGKFLNRYGYEEGVSALVNFLLTYLNWYSDSQSGRQSVKVIDTA